MLFCLCASVTRGCSSRKCERNEALFVNSAEWILNLILAFLALSIYVFLVYNGDKIKNIIGITVNILLKLEW